MRTNSPVRARKSLGQHWLTDSRALRRIFDAADLEPEDTVVEIGPGTGRLTTLLAQGAQRLIALEIDAELCVRLRERFEGTPAVTVLQADVLKVPPSEVLSAGAGATPYVVVGNLPYYIGTAVVRHFLYGDVPPRRMVVMLQADVAESVAAGPGDRSYLSVMVQGVAEARVMFRLPPSAFKPAPKVRSAVVRLDLREPRLLARADEAAFLEFAQAGVAAPRKTLRNSLAVGLRVPAAEVEALLGQAGIATSVRPANLEIEDWLRLFELRRAANAP